MSDPRPTLVVVSGPPGTGKTTLARALATAIGCPAICRDEIKEGMVHAHGPGFVPGPGDDLTQRTFPLFFEVVRLLVEGGVTAVAEAAFQDARWRAGLAPLLDRAQLRVVRCTAPAAVSFERAVARAATEESRRRAHGSSAAALGPGEWAEAVASFEHLTLDVPWLEVDTSDGYTPGLAEVVAFVGVPGDDARIRSTRA